VYRVLNSDGKVNPHWEATDPNLPQTTEEVRDRLIAEGVEFVDDKASQAQRWKPEDWTAAKEEDAGGVSSDGEVAPAAPVQLPR
jgi:hypothetical protein